MQATMEKSKASIARRQRHRRPPAFDFRDAPIRLVHNAQWCFSLVGGVKNNISHALSGTGGREKEKKSTDAPREDSTKEDWGVAANEGKSGEKREEGERKTRPLLTSFLYLSLGLVFLLGVGRLSLSLSFSFLAFYRTVEGGPCAIYLN